MLLSLWFLLTLVGITVVIAGVLVYLEVRRHRRRRLGTLRGLRAWTTRLGSIGLVLALVAVTIADRENRVYQYIPNFGALVGSPSPDMQNGGLNQVGRLVANPASAPTTHGVDIEVTVPGPRSHITRIAYVYLPAAYFQPAYRTTHFPVLYLIHGSPGVAVDWIRGGQVDRTMDHLLSHGAVQPFIIVMPDANGGFQRDLECQNVVHGPEDQTYLAEDVPAWVDAHLRTAPDRLHRAIGGLSTGAYCGLNLMFRHQGTFSAAVSHSGTGKPDHGRYTGDLFHGHDVVKLANTPDHYLRSIHLRRPTAVYLDAGVRDTWAQGQYRELRPLLLRRGIPTTYHVVADEKHSYGTWRRNVNLSLPWVSTWFTRHFAPTVADHVARPDTSYLPKRSNHYKHKRVDHRSHGPVPPPTTKPATTIAQPGAGPVASATRPVDPTTGAAGVGAEFEPPSSAPVGPVNPPVPASTNP